MIGTAGDEWRKDLAPSDAPWKWFGHDSNKWQEFTGRYRAELRGKDNELKELARQAQRSTMTLLYAVRDATRNKAMVLRGLLEDL